MTAAATAAGSTSWCRCSPAQRLDRPSPLHGGLALLGVGVAEREVGARHRGVRRRRRFRRRRRYGVGEVAERQSSLLALHDGPGPGVREQPRDGVLRPPSGPGRQQPVGVGQLLEVPSQLGGGDGGRVRSATGGLRPRRPPAPPGVRRPARRRTTRRCCAAPAPDPARRGRRRRRPPARRRRCGPGPRRRPPSRQALVAEQASDRGPCRGAEQRAGQQHQAGHATILPVDLTRARICEPATPTALLPMENRHSPRVVRHGQRQFLGITWETDRRQRPPKGTPSSASRASPPSRAVSTQVPVGREGEGVLEVRGQRRRRRCGRSSRRRPRASRARRRRPSARRPAPGPRPAGRRGRPCRGWGRWGAGAWPSRCRARCSPGRSRSRPGCGRAARPRARCRRRGRRGAAAAKPRHIDSSVTRISSSASAGTSPTATVTAASPCQPSTIAPQSMETMSPVPDHPRSRVCRARPRR